MLSSGRPRRSPPLWKLSSGICQVSQFLTFFDFLCQLFFSEPIMTFSLHSRFIEAAKCDSYSRRLSQVLSYVMMGHLAERHRQQTRKIKNWFLRSTGWSSSCLPPTRGCLRSCSPTWQTWWRSPTRTWWPCPTLASASVPPCSGRKRRQWRRSWTSSSPTWWLRSWSRTGSLCWRQNRTPGHHLSQLIQAAHLHRYGQASLSVLNQNFWWFNIQIQADDSTFIFKQATPPAPAPAASPPVVSPPPYIPPPPPSHNSPPTLVQVLLRFLKTPLIHLYSHRRWSLMDPKCKQWVQRPTPGRRCLGRLTTVPPMPPGNAHSGGRRLLHPLHRFDSVTRLLLIAPYTSGNTEPQRQRQFQPIQPQFSLVHVNTHLATLVHLKIRNVIIESKLKIFKVSSFAAKDCQRSSCTPVWEAWPQYRWFLIITVKVIGGVYERVHVIIHDVHNAVAWFWNSRS